MSPVTLNQFLALTYGWKLAKSNKPTPDSLLLTYRLLFQQAVKTGDNEDQSSALENLKTFAGNWIAILCNEDGDTTIPGQGVFDKLHRQLARIADPKAEAVWEIVHHIAKEALQTKATMDASWKQRESVKLIAKNTKAKKPKSADEIAILCKTTFDEKLEGDREGLKNLVLKAFSPAKTKKYCSLSPDVIESAIHDIRAMSNDDKRFLRLRYAARDNSMEQPLFRFLWLREHSEHGDAVTKDLLEYVSKEKPEAELRDDDNRAVTKMPYQQTGKEPLFPYFTNCLGIVHSERAAWFEFDKSAFKRAAEEVFKYKIRSDARESIIKERKRKLDVLKAEIDGDSRAGLMETLLAELGGAIGYGMRRATIGGWADLRQEFLKIAKKSDPIDEDELLAGIEKARDASGGGFGSGGFFKALCEEEFHPLWLPLKNPQSHHPKNFVRWWVLYSEAKEELKKVWDDDAKPPMPKPIAFTWPSTENRHGETSFRPLDFDIPVMPTPDVYLFDREGDGKPVKLVKANAEPPKQSKSKKAKSVEPPPFTDAEGNALYPLTLSYRRFKRDRIANADGSSVEAEYAPPLVAGKAPAFHEPGNEEPLDSSASLLPANKQGCWHFMFSFKLERDMQKLLIDNAAKIPGDKSVRVVKKTGKWVGLNLRWPIDLKTESLKKKDESAVILPNGDKIEEADAKFSVKKIWCSTNFQPFDILSVDLGVRYAGAWCRGRVKIGRDAGRPTERVISPAGHGQEIVYVAYDFGTFRLQGEDAKIWRKDKHKGFADEPELEKCGSRGRIASEIERAEFAELAKRVFPATKRFPVPDDPAELKFFPDLADHLTYRLRRQLGRIRFLFKLRWQIGGKKKKVGHEYKDLAGDELRTFRGEQRFNAIAALTFIPKENEPEETEDDFMRNLRLNLAPDELWSKLVYEHDGDICPLFSKVKGGQGKDNKENAKKKKAAQKAAWAKLKIELQSDSSGKWDWNALGKAVEMELVKAMQAFAGNQSLVAEAARFVWPLQDKKWKWNCCTITKDRKIEQSFLERDENSVEPKRFIHGMRGLSMKRIRLLQDFRQCCQSLAKLERRFYTDDNYGYGLELDRVQRGDTTHEPARAFLDKINELREQRVNQTAHMILVEALGLELMNPAKVEIDGKSKWQLKSERDLHGRYKQKKQRVATIVLEDLSRYRTSQDRSRYENSQLMEWSHRAVIAKLQDMAQVFGIQIITVDARFSSRFCSRTGVPGIRCAHVSKGFECEYPWKKWAKEKIGKAGPDGTRKATDRAELIQTVAELLSKCDDSTFTLILPMDGGPAFFPVIPHTPGKEGLEANADINAAVNIGLRAIAHPDRLDIFPVLRTEAKGDEALEIKNRRGSLSESATKADKRTILPIALPVKEKTEKDEAAAHEDASGDEELESGKFPYLYAAVRNCITIDDESRYQLPRSVDGHEVTENKQASVSAAKGKIYWSRVKQTCWKRIKWINAKRLQSKNVEPPDDWLNT